MTGKIMIVEDEKKMRILVADYLKREGYEIIEAENGEVALEIFEKYNDIDLIILDIMMPKYDGWTVCREIRKSSSMPIVMLTAKSQDSDELLGFELGVDEYITKPFKPSILVARINALFNRIKASESKILEFNGLSIDLLGHKVTINKTVLELSPKEYDLLIYLVENKQLALTRDQILDSVWGYDYFGGHRTVDTHIKRLRLKLNNKSEYIKTVRNIGYKFEVI